MFSVLLGYPTPGPLTRDKGFFWFFFGSVPMGISMVLASPEPILRYEVKRSPGNLVLCDSLDPGVSPVCLLFSLHLSGSFVYFMYNIFRIFGST